MRARAAFLHIAKCAGSSVYQSLVAAAGNPPSPPQQFDTCYLAGVRAADLVHAHARAVVAWDDHPDDPGPYVFHQHWSLPTLQRHFAAADIATVLREPRLRTLSFVEFSRASTAADRRLWAGDDVPMRTASDSLVDLLRLPAAARAVDNVITRQVMWGDPRLPVAAHLSPELADELAHDAIARLESLGGVGLVETMPATWTMLSDWLGTEVQPRTANRTPSRQVPGLFRTTDEIDEAAHLLVERSRADTAVWLHFARRSGHDTGGVEQRVRDRLALLAETAFVARYHRHRPGPPSSHPIARTLAERIAPEAPVLALDLAPTHVPRDERCTFVGPTDALATTEVQLTVEDRDTLDLRDALCGREFDAVVVGPDWTQRAHPFDMFVQLYGTVRIDTEVLVLCASQGDVDRLGRIAPAAGWGVAGVAECAGVLLVTCRMFGQPGSDPERQQRRRRFGRRIRSRS